MYLQRVVSSGFFMLALVAGTPVFAGSIVHSGDPDRAAGDLLQVGLPLLGLGTAWVKDDKEGMKQWAMSTGATLLGTLALKQAFNSTAWGERPNGGQDSFPSGHTASACAGAAFLGQRYGWQYGAAAMLPAAFVGYSRVDEEFHHWRDVIAGCALGFGINYWLVTPEKARHFTLYPDIGEHGVSLGFQMDF